jgi:HD-GYP domain-containing protein (c-di-GMP phosphodiesterase class II)
VREAAKLHDVGLVYIGADTLMKDADELDEDERGALALHPETGAQLARGAGIPEEVCEWLRRWSEHFDGSGAGGLAGGAIPVESRIIHAACRCDAAIASPPPSSGTRQEAAASALKSASGRTLDPDVVGVLREFLDSSAARQ